MRTIIALSLLLALLSSVSCTSSRDFGSALDSIVKPYRFNVAGWEAAAISKDICRYILSDGKEVENGVDTVNSYLALGSRAKAIKAEIAKGSTEELQSELASIEKQQEALAGTVETIIGRQVQQVLAEQGIYHPFDRYIKQQFSFPPPEFKLETPPHLLVISLRNKVQTVSTILLDADLSLDAMKTMEAQTDALNVSSLVVDLGGLGTYPSIVANDTSLQNMLETAAHEWTHEYLAFTPLGFGYILNIVGLTHNRDIVSMNETVANTIGREIGALIRQKYYHAPAPTSPPRTPGHASEFDLLMRDIRKNVDQYLAQGEIDQAEAYMRERRDYLATKGYYIRKLNQAYLAFNGQYADRPGFITPLGTGLRELRAKSISLKGFLDTVASMTSHQDLDRVLGQLQ